MRLTTFSLALAALVAPTLAFAQAPQTTPNAKPGVSAPATKTTPAPATTAAPAAAPATTPAAKTELLDINSATPEQLDALPGIGAVRTAAIIKGRPYKGKDDLVQKGIVPKNVYEAIKDKIIAKQK